MNRNLLLTESIVFVFRLSQMAEFVPLPLIWRPGRNMCTLVHASQIEDSELLVYATRLAAAGIILKVNTFIFEN